MQEPAQQAWYTVLIDPDRFDETVRALSTVGFAIEDQQREVGTVVGSIARDRVAAIGELEGVLDVEPEHSVELPPPDSDLQ